MEEQLTIVIPCFNEEESISQFFPELLSFAKEHSFLVIVVDDGSSDHSFERLEEIAREHSVLTVLHHKRNRGYGAAIKTGMEEVRTEFAITMDADGQHRLQDVLACFNAIRETDADLIVGARSNNASGNYRKFGKFLIRAFASSLFYLPVKDLNSGMKCYRMAEARPYLELCPDTMAFSDIILLLMLNDSKKVGEVPIEIMPRNTGKSTIGAATAMVTIAEILNLSVLLRPMTTFRSILPAPGIHLERIHLLEFQRVILGSHHAAHLRILLLHPRPPWRTALPNPQTPGPDEKIAGLVARTPSPTRAEQPPLVLSGAHGESRA